MLRLIHINNNSNKEALDHVAGLGANEIISLSTAYITKFKNYLIEGINKIIVSRYYDEINNNTRMKDFINFANKFETSLIKDCRIRGPCILGYDFYARGGGFQLDAPFLFGLPSQKRSLG